MTQYTESKDVLKQKAADNGSGQDNPNKRHNSFRLQYRRYQSNLIAEQMAKEKSVHVTKVN
ncbi:hypothetical protein ACMUMQ_12190 [Marinomonas sp. 2405UD66-6]|uniref:hypothetical protein n=1 Tax=Marinomonas sp. 2405UD66-6 TaxID=3391834 RepID=UPI0039C9B1C6